MKLTKSLLTVALAFTAIANAQEEKPEFSLTGEFRPRSEWLGNGQSSVANTGTKGYVQTSARTALNATYKTSSYTTYIGIQEVFNYGDRQQISVAGNGNFRIQEAWADLKISKALSFKVGRQPLSYDNQRILGGLNWAQQARTHDLGMFKFNKKGFSIDAGYSLNTNGSNIYNTAALFSYREMAFIHANKKFGKVNVSALILNNNFQANTPNKSNLTTAGVYFDTKLGALKLSGNGYIQDGQRVGDVPVDMAYLVGLDASIKASDKLTLGLGGEIISGKTANSAAFFPLYGTNHAFNGLMDRFYVGNYAGGNGLVDLKASAATNVKGYDLSLTGHYFKEQSLTKNYLGTELDFTVGKSFKGYKVVGGYSQYIEPNSVIGAKNTQNWAWIMLIIKPKFI